MPAGLDLALVIVAVALAAVYIVRRKLRMVKSTQRDWSSGHSESCGECGLMKIRQEQLKVTNQRS